MSRDGSERRGCRTALVTALAFTLSAALSSCNLTIGWSLGATHGVVIETGAARAGMNIYRVPTEALHTIYEAADINLVQDLLWEFGAPPIVTFCFQDKCISTEFINDRIHGWIYDDDNDLRVALIDAHDGGRCLSLTLISGGLYIKNWTHKAIGCWDGWIPGPDARGVAPTSSGNSQIGDEDPPNYGDPSLMDAGAVVYGPEPPA